MFKEWIKPRVGFQLFILCLGKITLWNIRWLFFTFFWKIKISCLWKSSISTKLLKSATKMLKVINWDKTCVNWIIEQGNHVIWSDGTKLNFFVNDGIKYSWKKIEESHYDFITSTEVKQLISVMIWGYMKLKCGGRICRINYQNIGWGQLRGDKFLGSVCLFHNYCCKKHPISL